MQPGCTGDPRTKSGNGIRRSQEFSQRQLKNMQSGMGSGESLDGHRTMRSDRVTELMRRLLSIAT